jgi:hypothetical protein
MANFVISGDVSGTVTLQAPAVSGTTTLTLPVASGTILTSASTQSQLPPNIAGNGPAFSATASNNQTISTNTLTKIVYDSKDFDTNNNFASNRFTPTVAGYYQFNYNIVASTAGASSESWIGIYKNGSIWQWGLDTNSITSHYWTLNGSSLIYFNGSTDYVEIYMYQTTGSNLTINPNSSSYPMRFSAFLARSA